MATCFGLERRRRNINKQQQNDLKLQDQQTTQLQSQKQPSQAIIKNQNYYTTQHQTQNQ